MFAAQAWNHGGLEPDVVLFTSVYILLRECVELVSIWTANEARPYFISPDFLVILTMKRIAARSNDTHTS